MRLAYGWYRWEQEDAERYGMCKTQYRTGEAKILDARESARVRAAGVSADGLGVMPSSVPGVLHDTKSSF